jgi:uncharacterized protein YjbJ (UPF0337 family)
MNNNEINGKVDQAKGKLKLVVGTATKDEDLKAEGRVDQAVGKVESAAGAVQRKTSEIVDKVAKAVKP